MCGIDEEQSGSCCGFQQKISRNERVLLLRSCPNRLDIPLAYVL